MSQTVVNAERVPFEAPKERSRVCFGGFRLLKHVEGPQALARGAPLSDPSFKLSESRTGQDGPADALIFWPNLSLTRSGIAGTC